MQTSAKRLTEFNGLQRICNSKCLLIKRNSIYNNNTGIGKYSVSSSEFTGDTLKCEFETEIAQVAARRRHTADQKKNDQRQNTIAIRKRTNTP